MKYEIDKKDAKREVEIFISDWLWERQSRNEELDSCSDFIDLLRSNSPGHLKFKPGSVMTPEQVVEEWYKDKLREFKINLNNRPGQ